MVREKWYFKILNVLKVLLYIVLHDDLAPIFAYIPTCTFVSFPWKQ
jgi:hypothetical protein